MPITENILTLTTPVTSFGFLRDAVLPKDVYRRYAAKARLLSAYEVAKSRLHSESLSRLPRPEIAYPSYTSPIHL